MRHQALRWIVGISIGFSFVSPNPGHPVIDARARLADRRAVEAVYWAHRTWPSANPGSKPSLAAAFPDSVLQGRVLDEMRKGAALARFWNRQVTAEQVQEEMNRMAAATKAPAVLRELFRALGNDPGRVAEALARPALEDRLLRSWYAGDAEFHETVRRRAEQALSGVRGVHDMRAIAGEYAQSDYAVQEEMLPASPGTDDTRRLDAAGWSRLVTRIAEALETPTGSSLVRADRLPVNVLSRLQDEPDAYRVYAILEAGKDHLRLATVSWPKRSFEDWWEEVRSDLTPDAAPLAGRFVLPSIAGDCTDDTWSSMVTETPYGRGSHTAIWTGSEMIVWGGNSHIGPLNTGYRYNPATDLWVPTAVDAATPAPRSVHTAVWTGSEMIVWGGVGTSNILQSGGRYDPFTDSWRTVREDATTPTARRLYAAVWTGREMIVWGGVDTSGSSYLNTGGRYDPATDTWTPTRADATAPEPRGGPTGVWTGSQMIVWGGFKQAFCCIWAHQDLDTGGRYDPLSDTWTLISGGGARSAHSAIWTGNRMIAWGGVIRSVNAQHNEVTTTLSSGTIYDPASNSWSDTRNDATTPSARSGHTAVWTGSEMIVWGSVAAGGRYRPSNNTWTPTRADSTAPTARSVHTAVWTGSEMIVWGGGVGFNTGGRYDPVSDTWVPTAATSPFPGGIPPQGAAIWTGNEMIVGGGRYSPATDSWAPVSQGTVAGTPVWTGAEIISWNGDNIVGRYDPTTDHWTTIQLNGSPTVGEGHTTIWTGTEVIVWGGYVCCTFYNTGGRYDPSTNQWAPTNAGNKAPVGRYYHSAVWTGSDMIVWGGYNDRLPSPPYALNDGGRYDPSSDTWSSIHTTPSVPDARYMHTAVWTGSEMIVFGGWGLPLGSTPLSATGWIYSPGSDSWRAARTDATTPEGRIGHAAVWTGEEMIVWGGSRENTGPGILASGGRYQPVLDSWSPTRLDATTPLARRDFSNAWTGTGLIAWGGTGQFGAPNTGGIYCASNCVTSSYFADADGDGYGDTAAPLQACSQPPGYVAIAGDCNDADPGAWAAPSEARDLMLPDPSMVQWSAPGSPGGLALVYDLLRSGTSGDFQTAADCVVSGVSVTAASDPEMPALGRSFFYLVRAADACPAGESALGTNSSGAPILGRSCP